MSFIPLRKKDISLSLMARDTLVAVLTSFAVCALVLSPYIYFAQYLGKGLTWKELLLNKILPISIFGVLII